MEFVFETERLILKVLSKEDREAAEKFWGDSVVMAQSGGATPHELLPKVLEGYRKCHVERGLSVYAVVEKKSRHVIGAAGFNVKDSLEKIELIYHFSKTYWGQGYATEAANACIAIAKQNPQVKIIYASADPLNLGSSKVLEKAGFQLIEMRWFEDTNQVEPYYEYMNFDK